MTWPSLGVGASFPDTVTYSTGAPGSGTLSLQVNWGDAGGPVFGTLNVTVNPLVQGPPGLALRNPNGDHLDRSLCLTSGAGEAAAWQCGDLLVAHGTPGYATMGRDRSLTLLYNSAVAVPRPAVAAAVTQTVSQGAPTTVLAELKVNSGAGFVLRASASYGGWASGTRQVVLPFTDTTSVSGIYPFQLVLTNQYPGGSYATTVTGNLIQVNRAASLYGRGWSVAGVEQLMFNQPVSTPTGDILWLGGDGSARRYTKLNATTWLAPPGAFRDTLVFSSAAQVYTRTLRHGVQVVFDNLGRQVQTIGRTGQRTRFFYNGTTFQLDSVRVPPTNSLTGVRYRLVYTGGKLDYVDDPASRRLDVTVAASGRLTAIIDPDTALVATQFAYDAAGRMTSRTSRRGYTTSYQYGNGLRLTRVIVPGTVAAGDTTFFQPWDEQGLALAPTGQMAVDTGQAYTRVLGPRVGVADDASFWIDRWGAPIRILNPLNQTTILVRGDAANPALVTRVLLPGGRIESMSYNNRGNLLQTRDSSLHLIDGLPTSVTTWTYNSPNTSDAPDAITDPEGVVTTFRYNSWGLDSLAIMPNGHQTRFDYKSAGSVDSLYGLVRAVVELNVPVWDSASSSEIMQSTLVTRFGFNAVGNVVADTSPVGRVRNYTRDARQLVITAFDAGGYRTDFTYDQLNRVTRKILHGELAGSPALYFPTDSGVTRPDTTMWSYALDVLTQVRDPRGVTRAYGFDRLGRQITETDDYGNVDSTWYNAAGAVDSTRSRAMDAGLSHGLKVRQSYDPGGRLVKTRWEARTVYPADSVVYTYDSDNRLLTAQRFAPGRLTTRTYFGNGLLKSERQSGLSTFRNAYTYDRAGKRLSYVIGPPDALFQFHDSIAYRYDATTGNLARIFVRWRHPAGNTDPVTQDSVRLAWDAVGRRDTVAFPRAGLTVRYAYDADGQVRLICGLHNPGTSPPADYVFHVAQVSTWVDANGRVRQFDPSAGGAMCDLPPVTGDNYTNTYDMQGQLLSEVNGSGWKFRYDRSGNMVRREKSTGTDVNIFTIAPGHNRLIQHDRNGALWTAFDVNTDGSRNWECPRAVTPGLGCLHYPSDLGYREYYYDGLGRTAGTGDVECFSYAPTNSFACTSGSSFASRDCGYDALGRMDSPCEAHAPFLGYDGNTVTRTRDDSTSFGWTFVHGPGGDDPLLAYFPGFSNESNAYFITDGNGRQYAVGDRFGQSLLAASCGGPCVRQQDYQQNGGRYSGTAAASTTFGADRFNSASHSGLTSFRNRFYDQATGRWTQEDPIGLAGGVNLYQLSGNNPVAFTDPFGLCPPKDNDPCNVDTGDRNLDDPVIRQNLEDAYKSAPESPQYPGYRQEVGGRCTAVQCTRHSDDIGSADIGPLMGGDLLNYHTHPNTGKFNPRPGAAPNDPFVDEPSGPDRTNAPHPSRGGRPSYIITPNSIYRLTPGGTKPQVDCFQRWNNSTAGC